MLKERQAALGLERSAVPRADLFITSALDDRVNAIPAMLRSQLSQLKMDYLDLYLVKLPDPQDWEEFEMTKGEVWKAMEHVKRDGFTREIGVVDYKIKDLKVGPRSQFHPRRKATA